jgi:hypothetical protein
LLIVSPDSTGTACPLSGRNSTYRPVQISGAGSFRGCASLARQSKIARLRAIVRKQTRAVPPIYQITVRHRAKRYPTNLTNDKENIR